MPQNLEYKGVEVSKYAPGEQIVVKIDGEWKLAKLTAPGSLQGKKLELEVEYYDTVGTNISVLQNRKLILDRADAPRIVSETDFTDPDSGPVNISKTEVGRDGTIEFAVDYQGQHYEGVSQEMYKLWRESVELRVHTKELENDLKKLSVTKYTEFIDKTKEVEKMIEEIFATMPKVEKMNQYDTAQVKKLKTRLGELMDRARKDVEDLKKSVAVEVGNNPPATHVDFYHPLTKAEKAKAEQLADVEAQEAKDLRAYLDQQIRQRTEAIDRERQQALATLRANQQGGQGRRRQNQQLTPDQERQFVDRKNNVKKEVYWDLMNEINQQNPNDPHATFNKKVLDEVDSLRIADAKQNRRVDNQELRRDPANNNVLDFDAPQDQVAYLNSKHLAKSMTFLDSVLEKYKNKAQLNPTPERGKEVFDFDAKVETVSQRIDALLGTIPIKQNNRPEDAYVHQYDTLQQKKIRIKQEHDALSTLENAQRSASGWDPAWGTDELRAQRELMIEEYSEELDKIEKEIKKVPAQKEIKQHGKDKKALAKSELETKMPLIDIPEPVMKELLRQRSAQVESAIKALLDGGINENGITPRARDTFKDIFSDTPPTDPRMLEVLKEAGIRNWSEFKELWDDELVEKLIGAIDQLVQAVLKKEVAERINLWDKTKQVLSGKFWKHRWGRVVVNGLLVGGTTAGLAALLAGTAGLGGAAVAVGGGFWAGTMRGITNKIFKGSKKAEEGDKSLKKELENKKKPDAKNDIVASLMGALQGHTTRSQNLKNKELPSIAGIFAQGIRDITTEEHSIEDDARIAHDLTGNARLLYEQVLAQVDTQDLDIETRKNLAQAILDLNKQGDFETAKLHKQLNPGVLRALETIMASYGGKRGILASSLMGGLVGGAFFADSAATRGIMGGVLGGLKGFKEGRALDIKAEQRKGREKIYEKISKLREFTATVIQNSNFDWNDPRNKEKRTKYKEVLLELKSALHFNPNADVVELRKKYGIAGTNPNKEVGGWVDAQGEVVINKQGKVVDGDLLLFFQDIRAAVADAERIGLLQEKKEDEQNLKKTLEQLKARGKELEKQVPKSLWDKFKNKIEKIGKFVGRNWRTGVGTVVGIGVGAVASIGVGALGSAVREKIFPTKGGSEVGESDITQDTEVHGSTGHDTTDTGTRSDTEAIVGAGAVATKGAENLVAPEALHRTSGNVESHLHEFKEKNIESFTSDIKKGEGVLHAADRAIQDAKAHIPELEGMNDRQLREWKIDELKRMGFKIEDGKWGYPFTVHKGATVEVYTEDGHPHLRVIGDEKQLTIHDTYKFKGEDGITITPERQAQVEAAKNNISDFSKQLHEATEVKSSSNVSVLPDDELKARLMEGGKIPGILDAEPAFDGRAVRLSLEGNKVVYVYPHHDAELRLGTDSSQDQFFWRIKSIEHSPAFLSPQELDAQRTGVGLTNSNIEVNKVELEKATSVMTREEHEKWIAEHEGAPATSSSAKEVAPGKNAAKTTEIPEPEKKSSGTTPKETELPSSISEKRGRFMDELDRAQRGLILRVEKIRNLPSGALNEFKSDIQEKFGAGKELIEEGTLDQSQLSPENYRARIMSKLNLHDALEVLEKDITDNSVRVVDKIRGIEGRAVYSDTFIKFKRGNEEFLFDVPEGYKPVSVDGKLMLMNTQTGEPQEIIFTREKIEDPGAAVMAAPKDLLASQ